MRKVRNLTIGGIQQKIFNLVLITILLVVCAYTVVTVYQAFALNKVVTEAAADMGSDSSDPAEARELEAEYEAVGQKVQAAFRESLSYGKMTITVLILVILVLGITSALILAKRIVRPLETITREIGSLSGENLRFTMKDEYRTGDEIEILAESFADISQKTLRYMDEVKRVTAENERIGTELALATRIQADMLPNIFPAFPERSEFDIYATMTPAKEVGGDFYDFFLIDEDHLGLVIADVSGKGVPAALFMMVSKILVQNTAMTGKSPAEILSIVNEQICLNNHEEMFVTVWLGILDLRSGELIAANAGHENPAIMGSGGEFTVIREKHSFVIGGMRGIRYRESVMRLEPGTKLFLYTDGVAEASNPSFELFGEARLLEVLNQHKDGTPREILSGVSNAVAEFSGKEPQADDLTMLCIEFFGKNH